MTLFSVLSLALTAFSADFLDDFLSFVIICQVFVMSQRRRAAKQRKIEDFLPKLPSLLPFYLISYDNFNKLANQHSNLLINLQYLALFLILL